MKNKLVDKSIIVFILAIVALATVSSIYYLYGYEGGDIYTTSLNNTMVNNTMTSSVEVNTVTNTSIAGEIVGLASRYLEGGEVNVSKLYSMVKKYVEEHGSPIIYGSKALFIYFGEAGSVSVPGDWNGWNPKADHMVRVYRDLWILLKEFPLDARLDYKLYVDGQWILDPYNSLKVLGGFGPNSMLVMPSHIFPPWYSVEKWVIKGRVDTLYIVNNYTGRRHRIDIYIPPANNSIEAIIYFYDGSDYLDYGYAAKIIDYMIHEKYLPNVLAVFVSVSNPSNRINEYGRELGQTASFLVEQVVPMVEERLGISNKSIDRVLVGDSLAGLEATYTIAKYPSIFRYGLIQSPAYWFSLKEIKNTIQKSTSLKNHKTYIDYGSFEGEGIKNHVDEVKELLIDKDAVVEINVTNQGHSWGQWREYLGYGLIWLLGQYS